MHYIFADKREHAAEYANLRQIKSWRFIDSPVWLFGVYDENVTVLKSAMQRSDYDTTIRDLKVRRCIINYEE